MRPQSSSYRLGEFVALHDQEWLEKQRVAGKVAAGAISLLVDLVEKGSSLSMLQMNALAEEYIADHHCLSTFKNYKGFPAGVCISINQQLVHGVPTDYVAQEGDLISFDLGATYKGAIGDTATTIIYGAAKSPDHTKLLQATKEALKRGIEAAKVGNRIGDIGHAIYKSAKANGYNVYERWGGHGITSYTDANGEEIGVPHASPFVANKSTPSEGIRIVPELVIAIEPLLTVGSTDAYIAQDGWTVVGLQENCHEEHTIFVHEDYTEVITQREGEVI